MIVKLFITLNAAFLMLAPFGLLGQNNCPTPPPKGNYSVLGDSRVYVSIDATNLPGGAQPLVDAMNDWNQADGNNGSLTEFVLAPAGVMPAVIVNVNTGPKLNSAMVTTAQIYGLVSSAHPATTTIYINATFASGSPMFAPTQNGYARAVTLAFEHELGHLQGAGDYDGQGGSPYVPDPFPFEQVMNPFEGTNESANNAALLPSDCDAAMAITYSQFQGDNGGGAASKCPSKGAGCSVPPDQTPPEGGSGGSSPSCDGGEYWDPTTNTLYAWC